MGAIKIDKSNRHYKERKEEEKKTLLNKVKKKTEMKRLKTSQKISKASIKIGGKRAKKIFKKAFFIA